MREEALPIEGARARRARQQRIIDDRNEIARDARTLAAHQVAGFPPDRAAHHAARHETEDRTGSVRIKDDRRFAGRDLARAELSQGATGGLAAHVFGRIELGEVALGAVMKPSTLLSALVFSDGRDDER